MRLIDADALEQTVHEIHCKDCDRRKGMKNGKMRFIYDIGDVPCRACELGDMFDYLDTAPEIDAVPVVRCGECKNYRGEYTVCAFRGTCASANWYCSHGERKENENGE